VAKKIAMEKARRIFEKAGIRTVREKIKVNINISKKLEESDKKIKRAKEKLINLLEGLAKEEGEEERIRKGERKIIFYIDKYIEQRKLSQLNYEKSHDSFVAVKNLTLNYIAERTVEAQYLKQEAELLKKLTPFDRVRIWVSDRGIAIIGAGTIVGGAVGVFAGGVGSVGGARIGFRASASIVALIGISLVLEGGYKGLKDKFTNTSSNMERQLEKQYNEILMRKGVGDVIVSTLAGIGNPLTALVLTGASANLIYKDIKRDDVATAIKDGAGLVIGAGGLLKILPGAQQINGVKQIIALSKAPEWLVRSGIPLNLAFAIAPLMFDEKFKEMISKKEYWNAFEKMNKGLNKITNDFIAFDICISAPLGILKRAVRFKLPKIFPEFARTKKMKMIFYLESKEYAKRIEEILTDKVSLGMEKRATLRKKIWEELLPNNTSKVKFAAVVKKLLPKASEESIDKAFEQQSTLIFEAQHFAEESSKIPSRFKNIFDRLKKRISEEGVTDEYIYGPTKKELTVIPRRIATKKRVLEKVVVQISKEMNTLPSYSFRNITERNRLKVLREMLMQGEHINQKEVKTIFGYIGYDINNSVAKKIVDKLNNIWKEAKREVGYEKIIGPLVKKSLDSRSLNFWFFVSEIAGFIEFDNVTSKSEKERKNETEDIFAQMAREYDFDNEQRKIVFDAVFKKIKEKYAEIVEITEPEKPELIITSIVSNRLKTIINKAKEKNISIPLAPYVLLSSFMDGDFELTDEDVISRARKVQKFLDETKLSGLKDNFDTVYMVYKLTVGVKPIELSNKFKEIKEDIFASYGLEEENPSQELYDSVYLTLPQLNSFKSIILLKIAKINAKYNGVIYKDFISDFVKEAVKKLEDGGFSFKEKPKSIDEFLRFLSSIKDGDRRNASRIITSLETEDDDTNWFLYGSETDKEHIKASLNKYIQNIFIKKYVTDKIKEKNVEIFSMLFIELSTGRVSVDELKNKENKKLVNSDEGKQVIKNINRLINLSILFYMKMDEERKTPKIKSDESDELYGRYRMVKLLYKIIFEFNSELESESSERIFLSNPEIEKIIKKNLEEPDEIVRKIEKYYESLNLEDKNGILELPIMESGSK